MPPLTATVVITTKNRKDELRKAVTSALAQTAPPIQQDFRLRLVHRHRPCFAPRRVLNVGGYRDYIVHQGEENDYCLRMLDAGYVVRLGRADPIHHYESPRRSFRRMSLYGSRNAVVEVWHNVPAMYVPVRWVRAIGGGLLAGIRTGRIVHVAQGLAWGVGCVFVRWKYRQPVSIKTYKLFRRLIRGGAQPLDEIEAFLPVERASRPLP